MKSILITGANKGIGLAAVEAVLRERPEVKVLLGSRDPGRGARAREALSALDASWAERVEVVAIDVACDDSVASAAKRIAAMHEGDAAPLMAIVNNAGAIRGSHSEVLDVNLHGIRRVCHAMTPLVERGGRIVNVTSASGPNFVSRCEPERRAFFTAPASSWEPLEEFVRATTPDETLTSLGMGGGAAYGWSKACANTFTMILARRHPDLVVNACTPGYIDTDLGRATLAGRTPEEAGMKQPADGARVIVKLLFDAPRGRGHYYGSDGLRSPMDRYRAPGSPEYTGD